MLVEVVVVSVVALLLWAVLLLVALVARPQTLVTL
jgi:hypothetical protein